MSQEINKHIAQAIAEIAVFLEFSGEEAINPDAAVQALEQLASTLQMGKGDRFIFRLTVLCHK